MTNEINLYTISLDVLETLAKEQKKEPYLKKHKIEFEYLLSRNLIDPQYDLTDEGKKLLMCEDVSITSQVLGLPEEYSDDVEKVYSILTSNDTVLSEAWENYLNTADN